MPIPRVIYEDNHLLVVDKPAGIPTAGVTDRPSVYQWTGAYLKKKYAKPGNVYVGIVSRLDTVTSGVLVVAKTSKAAGRLSEQLRLGKIHKTYLAVVSGNPTPESGQLVDWVYKEDDARRMRVVQQGGVMNPQRTDQWTIGSRPYGSLTDGSLPNGSRGQEAVLNYEVVARRTHGAHEIAMLRVELVTGRKHQIRVQFSSRGWPIWGDRKYGHAGDFPHENIALHAWQLRFEHPTRREPLEFSTEPPSAWQQLFRVNQIPGLG